MSTFDVSGRRGTLPVLLVLFARDLQARAQELRQQFEELEEHTKADPDASEAFDDARTSLRGFAGTLPNVALLGYSLLNSSDLADRAEHSFCELVRDCLRENSFVMESHGLSVVTETSFPLSDRVMTNAELFKVALQNLLKNSAQHSQNGDVVRVELVRRDDLAVVRILDRGLCVPQELRSRLFEPTGQLQSRFHRNMRYSRCFGLFAAAMAARLAGADVAISTDAELNLFELSTPLI